MSGGCAIRVRSAIPHGHTGAAGARQSRASQAGASAALLDALPVGVADGVDLELNPHGHDATTGDGRGGDRG